MRIHLAIMSLSPPQAFVQAGGQCLCSTKPYSMSGEFLGEHFDPPVHISNTGLNMKEEQKESFFKNKPVIGRGQQIQMWELEKYLAKSRPEFDRNVLWSQILRISKDVVHYLSKASPICRHGKLMPEQFFDILGMDLILDENLKVWMCETNGSPSLCDQDREVHGRPNPDFKKENKALSQVWHDTLTLLGLDGCRRHARGTLQNWYELDFSIE